jgi:LPS-assembly lipoprotein
MLGRVRLVLALTLCLLGLTACGFTPLHAPQAFENGEKAGALRGQVALPAPPGETGYVFRQALRDSLGLPGGEAGYVLEATLSEELRARTIAVDASVTSYEALVRVDWSLRARSEDKRLAGGQSRSITPYDVPEAQFAGLTARRDALRRAAQDAARSLALEVLVALRNHGETDKGRSEAAAAVDD